jgi:hypothetical protein
MGTKSWSGRLSSVDNRLSLFWDIADAKEAGDLGKD